VTSTYNQLLQNTPVFNITIGTGFYHNLL